MRSATFHRARCGSGSPTSPRIVLDLSGVDRLDTLGAWVLDRTRSELGTAGAKAEFAGLSEAQKILLQEIAKSAGLELKPEDVKMSDGLES